MNRDKAIEKLVRLGITENEANVYLALLNLGAGDAATIAEMVGIKRASIYAILKSMESKGLLVLIPEEVTRYKAVPIKQFIDQKIVSARRELDDFTVLKEQLDDFDSLRPYSYHEAGDLLFIKQRPNVYRYSDKMMLGAKREIMVYNTAEGVLRGPKHFFSIYRKKQDGGVRIRQISPLTPENRKAFKELTQLADVRVLSPPMITLLIVDEDEILLSRMMPDDDSVELGNDIAIWTNDRGFVKSFATIFNELWQNAREPEI